MYLSCPVVWINIEVFKIPLILLCHNPFTHVGVIGYTCREIIRECLINCPALTGIRKGTAVASVNPVNMVCYTMRVFMIDDITCP